MDRRAKKLEKKRKGRAQTKKTASARASRKPNEAAALARLASREPFGSCFVSAGWDQPDYPNMVTVVVTRELAGGLLAVGSALVDRTCTGIKNAMVLGPISAAEVYEMLDRMGANQGGMVQCYSLIVQSIVFHALDYARALGFEPHRDFEAALFGPRPETMLDTPFSKPARPIYKAGPRDDTAAIRKKLTSAVGADGFDERDPRMVDADEGALSTYRRS